MLPGSSEGAVPALDRAADALVRAEPAPGRPHACDAAFGLRVTEILAAAEARLAAGSGLAPRDVGMIGTTSPSGPGTGGRRPPVPSAGSPVTRLRDPRPAQ